MPFRVQSHRGLLAGGAWILAWPADSQREGLLLWARPCGALQWADTRRIDHNGRESFVLMRVASGGLLRGWIERLFWVPL